MQGRFDESGKKNLKLDAKDRQLLELLHADSRRSFTSLAKELRLSRDAVRYRMNKLEKDNVIIDYVPIINLEELGYSRYFVLFHLGVTQPDEIAEFIEHIKVQANVINVIEFSDKWDVQAEVVAKNLEELDNTLSAISTDAVIENSEILLVAEEFKDNNIPLEMQKNSVKKKKKSHKCDHKDILLLQALSTQAREPAHVLATQVQMPLETAYARVKKLFSSSVITRSSVKINLSTLGYESYILLVSMKTMGEEEIRHLKMLAQEKEVINAYRLMGAWNAIFHVSTQEPEELHSFIREMRTRLGPMLRKYDSLMTFKEHKYKEFPINTHK